MLLDVVHDHGSANALVLEALSPSFATHPRVLRRLRIAYTFVSRLDGAKYGSFIPSFNVDISLPSTMASTACSAVKFGNGGAYRTPKVDTVERAQDGGVES